MSVNDDASTHGAFSHLDARGEARMVDVGHKEPTKRRAAAVATVRMREETLAAIQAGGVPKGDVLAVARIAGIQAAKQTHLLVPLCHPLPLEQVVIEFAPVGADRLRIRAEVRLTARTGAEMEALTAVLVAALTVYDMCKATDPAMVVEEARLDEKEGGKKGLYVHPDAESPRG